MLRWIDRAGRSGVAVPLLVVGIALTMMAEWMIRCGAWLVDVDTTHD
jgi:hypothetical protein